GIASHGLFTKTAPKLRRLGIGDRRLAREIVRPLQRREGPVVPDALQVRIAPRGFRNRAATSIGLLRSYACGHQYDESTSHQRFAHHDDVPREPPDLRVEPTQRILLPSGHRSGGARLISPVAKD